MGAPAVGGEERARVPWGALAWWVLVGALAGFAVAALLSIGVLVVPVVLLLGAGGLLSARLRRGTAPGLLLGVATTPLWLAWLNRSGPGTVCESTATSQTCHERLSPWPFLLVGLTLAGVGLALVHRRARTAPGAAVHGGVPPPP